jgi:signal transduction histidine kinase
VFHQFSRKLNGHVFVEDDDRRFLQHRSPIPSGAVILPLIAMLRKALSISHILLAAFLLAGLLPAAVVTAMAFSEAREALEIEIGHDLQARASSTATEIDRMMFERLQNVASWSSLEIMQELRVGDVDKRLSRFLAELKASYSGVYVELHAVAPNGMIVASSEPAKLGQKYLPVDNRPGVVLSQDGVRALPLVADHLPLSTPISDAIEGGETGIFYAVFDWSQIRQILASATSDGSSAALFDRHGILIASTPGWSAPDSGEVIAASAESKGYQGFAGFGWKVTLTQTKKVALEPVRQMGKAFILLLGSTLIIAALVVMPIAAGIAHPLGRLSDFARNFIREQRGVPPPGGPAEVRELSSAFSQMIQDLERLKESLTHAAKLAVVGEMAAAMTHEVRTPLGILRSSAQLLLREPALSEEGREVCGFIISETERMNRLVSTLLDSARARLPEPTPVNLASLAQQAIAMLSAQAGKKKLALTLDGDPDNPDNTASCDTEQITQVLLNLLLNAIQIVPENGRIEVTVRRESDTIVLEVADDGPGIAPELCERIFDPFFSQRSGGIGLGLAVVRQIVAAHHGAIHAGRSRLGGALFSLRLPVAFESTS